MSVLFDSKDVEWTESMKQSVQDKIVAPLEHRLHGRDFDLCVRLEKKRRYLPARPPRLRMSLRMLTPDGKKSDLAHGTADEFQTLLHEVSSTLRTCVRKHQLM